jgi:hypothetical protein
MLVSDQARRLPSSHHNSSVLEASAWRAVALLSNRTYGPTKQVVIATALTPVTTHQLQHAALSTVNLTCQLLC